MYAMHVREMVPGCYRAIHDEWCCVEMDKLYGTIDTYMLLPFADVIHV